MQRTLSNRHTHLRTIKRKGRWKASQSLLANIKDTIPATETQQSDEVNEAIHRLVNYLKLKVMYRIYFSLTYFFRYMVLSLVRTINTDWIFNVECQSEVSSRGLSAHWLWNKQTVQYGIRFKSNSSVHA